MHTMVSAPLLLLLQDMENCRLLKNIRPQEYFDMLSKVFMSDTGVAKRDFRISAFISLDNLTLLTQFQQARLTHCPTACFCLLACLLACT